MCYSTVAFNKPYVTPKIFHRARKVLVGKATFPIVTWLIAEHYFVYCSSPSDLNRAKNFSPSTAICPPVFTSVIQQQLIIYFCSSMRNAKDTSQSPSMLTSSEHSASLSEALLWFNTLLWVCVWWDSIQYIEFFFYWPPFKLSLVPLATMRLTVPFESSIFKPTRSSKSHPEWPGTSQCQGLILAASSVLHFKGYFLCLH